MNLPDVPTVGLRIEVGDYCLAVGAGLSCGFGRTDWSARLGWVGLGFAVLTWDHRPGTRA